MQYSFITELIKRFGSQSPKFFKIMQIIAMVGLGLAGVLKWAIEAEIWTLANQVTAGKVSHILTAALTFFGGVLFSAGATTTKAELQDDKTVKDVLSKRL